MQYITPMQKGKGQHYQIFEVINITLFNAKKRLPSPMEQTRHQKIQCQRTEFLKPKVQEISIIFEKSPDNCIDTEGTDLTVVLIKVSRFLHRMMFAVILLLQKKLGNFAL